MKVDPSIPRTHAKRVCDQSALGHQRARMTSLMPCMSCDGSNTIKGGPLSSEMINTTGYHWFLGIWLTMLDRLIHTTYACMYASNTREMSPKLDFNTKILLTSWIMHRFQRFLMFWKAECLLFHLETTFPHCFVFVRSKTWHLWKVCLIYWTNAGSSIHFGAGWRSLSSWVGRKYWYVSHPSWWVH